MNYIKISKNDVANGPGVRVVLWVSGCSLHCKGCHNQSTWSFDSGSKFDSYALAELLTALAKPHVKGITFSGGHPLEPQNLSEIANIISIVRQTLPTKDIWLYTGYTLTMDDFLLESSPCATILRQCDVVVDGPYIEEERNLMLKFRGSNNQRLIDVQTTLNNQQITMLEI